LAGVDTEHDYLALVSLAKLAEYPIPIPILESHILPQVKRKLPRYGDRPEFLFHVSNIRIRQLATEEAVALLRQVTQLDPSHVIAWNNLAALLAESDEHRAEARTCAEKAMSLTAEPLDTVIDTMAMVHAHAGEHREGLTLLERVTSTPDGVDPRFFFHKAWVHHLLGDEVAAQATLRVAEQLNLADRYLTRKEREALKTWQPEGTN